MSESQEAQAAVTSSHSAYYTKDQEAAIGIVDRPVLVIAPAGTGKTTIITAKYQRLVGQHGVASTMAITFTKKAAAEIRKRVVKADGFETPLSPRDAQDALVGTFHHIGSIILKKAAKLKLYNGPLTLADEQDQRVHAAQAIRTVPGAANEAAGRNPKSKEADKAIRDLMNLVDRIKNTGWRATLDGYTDESGRLEAMVVGLPGQGSAQHALAVAYQDALQASGNLDFNDIILNATAVLRAYRDAIFPQLRFLLVDEYQDTNDAQEKFISVLSKGIHLTCVGDDDQAIYGWRGARVDNMLGFSKRHPDAAEIALESNYRSTPEILACAKALIGNNLKRLAKEPSSQRSDPGKTGIYVHDVAATPGAGRADVAALKSSVMTAKAADVCMNLMNEGIRPGDIAIIVRTNAEADAVVSQLQGRRILAKVSSPNAVSSNELKTLTAWLKVLQNPADASAAAVLCGSHSGDLVFMDIATQARRTGVPVMEYLSEKAAAGKLTNKGFITAGERYASLRATAGEGDMTNTMNAACALALDIPGKMKSSIKEEHFWNLFGRLAVRAAQDGDFLDCIEILQTQISEDDVLPDDEDLPVEVSTVHSMKGRQKSALIISAFVDGIIPMSQWARTASEASLTEERRLAYVAITRARDQLHILTSSAHPARFAAECGAAALLAASKQKGAA